MSRIIIAECEPAVRALIRRMVDRIDPTLVVDEVDTGIDLLDYYADRGATCLIVDALLPRLDGLTAVRLLRDDGATVPIVVTVGHTLSDLCAYQAGASAVLFKPFDGAALRATLDQLI